MKINETEKVRTKIDTKIDRCNGIFISVFIAYQTNQGLGKQCKHIHINYGFYILKCLRKIYSHRKYPSSEKNI